MSVITLIPSTSLSAFLLEGSNAYLSRLSPHLQFCSSPSSGNGKDACKTYEHFLREGCVGSREESLSGEIGEGNSRLRSGRFVSHNIQGHL